MRTGQMVNNIDAIDEAFEQFRIGYIAIDHFKTGQSGPVTQTVKMDVDRSYVMSLIKLAIHQMTSDEATCTGDQNLHSSSRFSAVTMTALFVRRGSKLSNRLIARTT